MLRARLARRWVGLYKFKSISRFGNIPKSSFERGLKFGLKNFKSGFSTKEVEGKPFSWDELIKNTKKLNVATQKDLKDLLSELEKRRYNVNLIKWTVGLFGVLLALLSGKQIKSFLSQTTSEVTQQSMDDPSFQTKVTNFSSLVAKDILEKLLQDSALQSNLKNYVKETIQDSVLEIYKDEAFREETQKRIGDLIVSDLIKRESEVLAKEVAENLLKDSELKKQMGNTIRDSVVYGFLPTYFHGEEENIETNLASQ